MRRPKLAISAIALVLVAGALVYFALAVISAFAVKRRQAHAQG